MTHNKFTLSRIKKDALVLAGLCLAFFFISSELDLLERTYELSREYEYLELDEWIPTLVFMAFALAGFSLRRWYEIRVLHGRLEKRHLELEAALSEIRQLKGIIPICSSCKKIRDDKGYWQQVEEYVEIHTKAQFSHSMCPECLERHYGKEAWFSNISQEEK